ncbi:MAG: hypothetical protein M1836_004540 [Candelina mexicana]|nr:MAG: hypothetical protein M1836_004540 [Candelina mexicana]
MRWPRRSTTNPTILLCSAILFSLLITAQDLPALTNAPQLDATTASSAAPSSASAAAPSSTSPPDSKTSPSATTTLGRSPESAAATSSFDGITGLPTQQKAYDYPAPSVPPTADAPFMRSKTNYPEGTVFIIVGAALGFFGFSILAWRGLVAWSLHRSVRRAALQHSITDAKTSFRPSGNGIYSDGPNSTLSLDHLAATGRTSGKRSTNHTPRSSLFFSPTAGTGMHTPGNRGSGYLPAGYYAAGNSAPGSSSGMTSIGGNIGLSTLGAQSQGYSRARSMGPSPPSSPTLPPSRGGESAYRRNSHGGLLPSQASTSTLNLSMPPQGRAPSTFLEDLFESHQPEQAPGGRPASMSRY